MERNFSQYTPTELLGKLVLYEWGMSYNSSYNRGIRKITTVTKTGFRISDLNDKLFSLASGNQKGLNSRMDVGVHSTCYLITEEEANAFRAEWAKKKQMKEWKQSLETNLPKLTYEQLEQIIKIIG